MKYKKLNSLAHYSISPEEFSKLQIEHIIENDACHLVSLFKDSLIFDEDADFLRRFYYRKESIHRLNKLFEFYTASSMVFPNYTALIEGKYIYRNIMKKQKVIDLIEAMEDQKEKNETEGEEEDKLLQTKTYESIAFECDTSKIKEMFALTERDSIEDIERFTNKLIDIVDKTDKFRVNTNPNSSSLYFILNKNKSINRTATTETTLNNTNNNKNITEKENINHNSKRNKIKLCLAPDIKSALSSNLKSKLSNLPLFSHRQIPTMPIIDVKPPITHRKPSLHVLNLANQKIPINHNYMQSMPSELNSYRPSKKRKIKLYPQCNTTSNYMNPLTITSYSNKFSMKSSRISINDKTRQKLNLFTSTGWKSERKQGRLKIIK